jgi:hypothetical protein
MKTASGFKRNQASHSVATLRLPREPLQHHVQCGRRQIFGRRTSHTLLDVSHRDVQRRTLLSVARTRNGRKDRCATQHIPGVKTILTK